MLNPLPTYDPILVQPMREELTRIGIKELRTPEEVAKALPAKGTVLVVVNSVCGCAAGQARPGVALALTHSKKPQFLYTVFAGQDGAATAKAREHFTGQPPSSPSVALLKDGKLAFMLHRSDIENRTAQQVAAKLREAFDAHCA
jgi:putative YphP/YqiW family bacilliredoxin